jgi:hypothetical protein
MDSLIIYGINSWTYMDHNPMNTSLFDAEAYPKPRRNICCFLFAVLVT